MVDPADASPDTSSAATTNVEPAMFWTAVEERGFMRALGQFGFRYFLVVLRIAVVAYLANVQSGIEKRPLKSSEEVTREVFTEPIAAAEPRGQQQTAGRRLEIQEEQSGPDYQAILQRLQDREKTEQASVTQRLVVARGREKALFAAQFIAAVAAMILAFAAVALVFAGLVPLAAASGAVAILPGSGTVLLRRMWNKERSYRDQLDERRSEAANLIDAIEGALTMPDVAERNRLATQLAERLQERAFQG